MARSEWIGRKLNNRYLIEELLGQGGMSSVYKATDPNLRRVVAIKMIHPHLSTDPDFLRRFEEEASGVAQLRHQRIIRRVGEQHLLRGLYELAEGDHEAMTERSIPLAALMHVRSWSRHALNRLVRRAERDGLVVRLDRGHVRLTEPGFAEAWRVVRNHRLWEMYLITHADIAPSHVDRSADMIEHVLGGELVGKLESQLFSRSPTTLSD